MDQEVGRWDKIVELIGEQLDDYEGIAKLVPYAKSALAAVQYVRRLRMIRFLRSLHEAMHTPEARQRLEKLIESHAGQALLAEYADSVVRTSSPTANVGLGILYGDTENETFSDEFRRLACVALQGIAEDAIDLLFELLLLSDERPSGDRQPYWVHAIDERTWTERKPRYSTLSAAAVPPYAQDLINRGVLLPNPGVPIGIPVPSSWQVTFGRNESSEAFRRLLATAREYLGRQKPA